MNTPHGNTAHGSAHGTSTINASPSGIRTAGIAAIIAVALAVAMLASSCTTTAKFSGSAEECDYALHFVLGKANESTMSKLYFRISQTSSFLPDSLDFIAKSADEIPGMQRLLDEWSQSMGEYTMDWFEGFKEYVNALVEDITFADPEALVLESDESAATTMESVYRETIQNYVARTLASADLTKWDDVAAQYEAWVVTRKALYGEERKSLDGEDLVGDLSAYICDLYFADLKAAESLIRTTPDPNADPTVSKVFGLD